MSYTLDQFAGACRSALQSDSGPQGRQQILNLVRQALVDEPFIAAYFGPERRSEREILYEDPELGFCICAHVYSDAKGGNPHDHGPTWAIYGQVKGETEMTDWSIITPPADDEPGIVEPVRTYRMGPGDAHLYEVGDVHAPQRFGPTSLLRIEGHNTEKVKRTRLRAVG